MDHIQPKREAEGFTLLELLIVVSIVAILAAVSVPSYVRYVNEAKAAEFLMRVHQIALAYHEVLLVDVPKVRDLRPYDSPNMGEPPTVFDDLAPIYAEHHGIELGSFLVNHSNYFSNISDGEIPVLFLKANTDAGRDVLHALDHVTKNRHTFANPSLLMIALEDPVPRQTVGPEQTPLSSNPKDKPKVSTSDGAGEGSPGSDTQTGIDAGTTTTASTTSSGPSDTGSTTSTATSSPSSTTSQLGWPPGWAKHPEQHQGSSFPGHGHH